MLPNLHTPQTAVVLVQLTTQNPPCLHLTKQKGSATSPSAVDINKESNSKANTLCSAPHCAVRTCALCCQEPNQWWCLLAAALAADTMPANAPPSDASSAGAPCSTKAPLLSTSRWSQSRMVSILQDSRGHTRCNSTSAQTNTRSPSWPSSRGMQPTRERVNTRNRVPYYTRDGNRTAGRQHYVIALLIDRFLTRRKAPQHLINTHT